MKNLSKSRYTLFRQCPKALWLRIYKPEEATEDKALEARFAGRSHFGVTPPEAAFDAAVVFLPKSRELADYLLNAVAS